jgi:hypothetical protein
MKLEAQMLDLKDQPIGTKYRNQELIEKRSGGEYQLWKSPTGYGVDRIVDNKYVVLVRMGHSQKTARIVFDYYAPPLNELGQTDSRSV